MSKFKQIIFLTFCSFFLNCNHSTEIQKTSVDRRKFDVKYDAFVKYLNSKNLDLCQLKKLRLKIKNDAQRLADKKYPNSIAQHDKYIERITEREVDSVLEKYNLKTQDWSEARIYAYKYCK